MYDGLLPIANVNLAEIRYPRAAIAIEGSRRAAQWQHIVSVPWADYAAEPLFCTRTRQDPLRSPGSNPTKQQGKAESCQKTADMCPPRDRSGFGGADCEGALQQLHEEPEAEKNRRGNNH